MNKELETAKEIVSQLETSIDFLENLLANQEDNKEKNQIEKELRSARKELGRIVEEISKEEEKLINE